MDTIKMLERMRDESFRRRDPYTPSEVREMLGDLYMSIVEKTDPILSRHPESKEVVFYT